METGAIAQVNVRMDRDLKERGDATLALVGSSPARIIRRLWEYLATGGDAYERVMDVLSPVQEEPEADAAHERVLRSASLFQDLGASLGADIASFEPDLRPEHEIMEQAEWELLVERGLA